MHKSAILAGALTACLLSAPALAATDQDFLTKAIQGDNSEVTLGQLAQKQGGTSGVRSFGHRLVVDHGKAKTQAAAVARRLHVTVPTDMLPDAKTEYDKLKGLKGKDFDTEFVSFMVQDHQSDISDFQDQAKSGSAATAALAKRQLPTLEKHLKLAQALSGGK